jgi:hypothetical protein
MLNNILIYVVIKLMKLLKLFIHIIIILIVFTKYRIKNNHLIDQSLKLSAGFCHSWFVNAIGLTSL